MIIILICDILLLLEKNCIYLSCRMVNRILTSISMRPGLNSRQSLPSISYNTKWFYKSAQKTESQVDYELNNETAVGHRSHTPNQRLHRPCSKPRAKSAGLYRELAVVSAGPKELQLAVECRTF